MLIARFACGKDRHGRRALGRVRLASDILEGRAITRRLGWSAECSPGRTGMRELLVHAYLHRHALGDSSALAAAEVVAREVDNSFLHQTIAAMEKKRSGRHLQNEAAAR